VNIRFASTLTPEDENILAPAVLKALSSILDLLPIAYMIRIDTSDAKVYQHTGAEGRSVPIGGEPPRPPANTLTVYDS
jgi:hypothetical protein